MCLGVPGKIIEIAMDGETAKVDVAGTKKNASLRLMANAEKGDYVILHAGFAIEKIDRKRALETLGILTGFGRPQN